MKAPKRSCNGRMELQAWRGRLALKYLWIVVLVLSFHSALIYDAIGAKRYFYVTANSVESLSTNLAQSPLDSDAQCYLGVDGCLGPAGPLGPDGPLGRSGPIGTNKWNPSQWINELCNWGNLSKDITLWGGPLDRYGPLGVYGPFGPAYEWYFSICPLKSFYRHLDAGGAFTVLGPIGPLGPLGSLGALGPIGAHDCTNDSNGQWFNSEGKVSRQVRVPFGLGSRSYDLFECYAYDFAKKLTNDTSFMVSGTLTSPGSLDSFRFKSQYRQFVTVLVVPESKTDDFDLCVVLGNKIPAVSNSHKSVDWIQALVKKDMELCATISLYTNRPASPTSRYRLYVVGSTKYINSTTITGIHQVFYDP